MTRIPSMDIRCDMVSILVLKETDTGPRLLLLRREKAYLKGVWSYVAGHLENGETGWQAACRELEEETGLTPRALYATSFCEQFYDAANECMAVVPSFVAYTDNQREVRLNREHSAFRWVSFDTAMETMPFGSQRDLLAHVRREFIDRSPVEHLRLYTGWNESSQ